MEKTTIKQFIKIRYDKHYIVISEDDSASIHVTQPKRSEAILRMIDNKVNSPSLKSSRSMDSLDVKAPNEVCAHHIYVVL